MKDDELNMRVKKKVLFLNGGICFYGVIFNDVSLKGGYKVGKFEFLIGVKNMCFCI